MLSVVLLAGARALFVFALQPSYTKYKSFVEMDLRSDLAPAPIQPSTLPEGHVNYTGKSRLRDIAERGSLRVCYFKDSLPFAFVNASGKLVGLDVEMAHLLANDLGVKLEFLQVARAEIGERLDAGSCDIAMSGFAVTPERTRQMAFSVSYMDLTMGFVVQDHRRHEFSSREVVRGLEGLRIGVPAHSPYYLRVVQDYLPKAELVPLFSPRKFFSKEIQDLDALVGAAEVGSAWTLVYPDYTVAVPLPDPMVVPLAYPMPRGEKELIDYVSTWIELKRDDNTIDELFDHWILGKHAITKGPRWSVIRNVLGWVD